MGDRNWRKNSLGCRHYYFWKEDSFEYAGILHSNRTQCLFSTPLPVANEALVVFLEEIIMSATWGFTRNLWNEATGYCTTLH